MFGITWSEMAVIAIVALILIGPKDLPVVLRTMGKWITAARGMAREFQGHVDDLVRESGLDEVRKNIRENTADTLNDLANHVDPDRSIREGMDPDKLMAGDGAKTSVAAADVVIATPAIESSPPTDAELAAFASSVGESIQPGGDYHPPADMPSPDTAPIEPLPPLPKETATATAEPAKNPSVAEPGRA
jgi:sec-independent protein translocase protein TatB